MRKLDVADVRRKSALSVWITTMVCLAMILVGCKTSEQTPNPKPMPLSRANAPAARMEKPLPRCPSGSSAGFQSNPARHHRVVLSWNPSDSSAGPNDKSLGYCLYRSEKPIVAKKIAKCKNCESINEKPILSTGCVDVDVGDGKTYFYAVLAIRAKNPPSLFSNKAEVHIPKKETRADFSSSYPFCREPVEPGRLSQP